MKTFNLHNGLNILPLEDNFSEYGELFAEVNKKSVYFLPSYLKSVCYAEKYPLKIMVFAENEKIAMISYIIRRINDLPFFRKLEYELQDIISPYEYSYPISNIKDSDECNSLFIKLFDSVGNYCKNNNIISEFIRFDPFLSNYNCIKSSYIIRKSCDNIYIDLRKDIGEIWKSFHSSAKKNIKRAISSDLKFLHANKTDENINLFIKLYRSSMQRLKAYDYYYFSDEYFTRLIQECEGASLFFIRDKNNRTVAASILLYYEDVAHHHLTGYISEVTSFRPNDYMIYSLIQWAKIHNLNYLHLGGGSESICNFKSKFSDLKIPFYIGCRIHNEEIYQLLCDMWRKETNFLQHSDYFPLYRWRN